MNLDGMTENKVDIEVTFKMSIFGDMPVDEEFVKVMRSHIAGRIPSSFKRDGFVVFVDDWVIRIVNSEVAKRSTAVDPSRINISGKPNSRSIDIGLRGFDKFMKDFII